MSPNVAETLFCVFNIGDWPWSAPVANWTQAVGSFAAVVAALFAYFQIRRQIGQAERHHREDLKAAHRPLLMVDMPLAVRRMRGSPSQIEGHTVELRIRNIGPGLAKDAHVSAWIRERRELPEAAEELARIDAGKTSIDIEAPQFTIRLGAMEAHESRQELLNAAGALPQLQTRPVLYYMCTYVDVFDNQYPEKLRDEWEVGHVLFPDHWERY